MLQLQVPVVELKITEGPYTQRHGHGGNGQREHIERALRGANWKSKFIADHFSIMTIYHSRQMRPPVVA